MTLPLYLSKWQTGAKNILILMRILANWKNALETFENVLKYPGNMWLAFFEIFGWMVRFYELTIWAFLDKFRLDVHMNLWEIFEIFSVQYRAVLRPIFMVMILLIGGKNYDSARKVRVLRKTTRVVGPTSLSGVKGMPTWEATPGMVSTLWVHIEELGEPTIK